MNMHSSSREYAYNFLFVNLAILIYLFVCLSVSLSVRPSIHPSILLPLQGNTQETHPAQARAKRIVLVRAMNMHITFLLTNMHSWFGFPV